MALTNEYGDITGTVAAKLEKQALKHVQPFLCLEHGAKKFTQPKNGTKTMRFRRAIPYAAATTALSEGVPPSATQIRYDQVDVTLAQYGGYTPVSDIMVDLHTTPILSDINQLNAEQVAMTRESLLWGKLRAATNVQYEGGTSLVTTDGLLSISAQQLAVRTLQRNKAKKFTRIVAGGVAVSTKAIEAAYIAFVHTDAEKDIRSMANFTPVAKYGKQETVCELEFGSVDNVRYVSSPDLDAQLDAGEALATTAGRVSNGGTKADVYTALFVGMDAYGCVNLAGKGAFTPVVRNVGKPTDSDPLGQIGHVGWKMYTAEEILNSDWIVAVKHTVDE
jgi:N4-gp56 family major capsid protein